MDDLDQLDELVILEKIISKYFMELKEPNQGHRTRHQSSNNHIVTINSFPSSRESRREDTEECVACALLIGATVAGTYVLTSDDYLGFHRSKIDEQIHRIDDPQLTHLYLKWKDMYLTRTHPGLLSKIGLVGSSVTTIFGWYAHSLGSMYVSLAGATVCVSYLIYKCLSTDTIREDLILTKMLDRIGQMKSEAEQ